METKTCQCGQVYFGTEQEFCDDCIEKLKELKEALVTEPYLKAEV